ncbi:MAG: hypothetical protein NTV86_00615 [Planctomycetota bacterium]|nr:hypothetical protein [Planctomycetota bacterium]
MKFARLSALVCLVAVAASAAQGAVITTIPLVDSQGRDSGWAAELPDTQAARNVTDIVVNPTDGSVTVTILKDFVGYTGSGADLEFPIGKITFRQTLADALTVPRIIVRGETIQNHTLLPWTAFVWNVAPTGLAWFNTAATAWNAAPFASQAWTDQTGSKANTLLASNGLVPDGATFSPAGSLVIDTNLAPETPVSFDFKEMVIPEPATISLLALASLGWPRRRRLAPRLSKN